MDHSTHRARQALGVTSSASSRPIFWLVTGWYLAMMLISGLLVLLQELARIDSTYISIVQLAPTIALLIVISVARSRTAAVSPAAVGRRTFLLRCLLAVFVIGAYAASTGVAAILLGATRDSPFDHEWLVLVYVVLQLVGACGEEFGWRGFLQPALETRMPRLASCVVTGVLWALWHVRFADLLGAMMFVLNCIALSILFGYLVRGSIWQRGFTAGAMHAVVNVTLFLAVDPGSAALERIPLPLIFLAGCAAVHLVRRLAVDVLNGRARFVVVGPSASHEQVTLDSSARDVGAQLRHRG